MADQVKNVLQRMRVTPLTPPPSVLRTVIFGLAYCVPFNKQTKNTTILGVSIYIKKENK